MTKTWIAPIRAGTSLAAVLALFGGIAFAAPAERGAPPIHSHAHAATPARTLYPLPANAVTHHQIALPGRKLSFTATAGTITLHNAETGAALANVAYIAYALDHQDVAKRPVTFVVNGGPGASSAWLQLGALGPWRLSMSDGTTYPSAAPTLIDNADTWLDFTDLVFIDPPGTGYSRILAPGKDVRKALWSVDGDIDALAVVIRRWLGQNGRLESPKFIVGESYGGFRAPRLAERLATRQGVGIGGLIMISPVLDFATLRNRADPLYWVYSLPSYAAAEWQRKNGTVTSAERAEVEAYAAGPYIQDLLRGPRDKAAMARMVARVSAFTGLDPALVRRLGGRIDRTTFEREFDRAQGKIVSPYDATVTGDNPFPHSDHEHWLDPVLDGLQAPLASAMVDLYAHRLGWKIENQYQILNRRVSEQWDWGSSRQALDDMPMLRRMLALDPNFRVLVAQGMTDLVTPYFGTKLLLDQLPVYGRPGRVEFKLYRGGHMLYTRAAAREAFRTDAERLIAGK